VYIDKRILTIDTPQPDRVQTSEKKNLLVDSFVKWRIADARRYWVSFPGATGSGAAAERINSLVRDALNQAVNKRTVNDVTSRERDKAMEEIRAAVSGASARHWRRNCRCALEAGRLRSRDQRIGLPPHGSRAQARRQ